MNSSPQRGPYQNTNADHESTNQQSPSTPKLPFEPPRRRSSLAFSRIISTPVISSLAEQDTCAIRDRETKKSDQSVSNIHQESVIALSTPFRRSGTTVGHVAQIQKFFQSAKATLHLDMQFAASPVGSIDSRLPSEPSPTTIDDELGQHQLNAPSQHKWRYSTMPEALAACDLDVREPIPTTSPELPAIDPVGSEYTPLPDEPTSSGFASPLGGVDHDIEGALPFVPTSSPPMFAATTAGSASPVALEGQMTDLRLEGDDNMDEQDSSLVANQEQSVASLRESPIFLSKTAEAAAESARFKRGFAKQSPSSVDDDENMARSVVICPEPSLHQHIVTCPDPSVHRVTVPEFCPNPSIHASSPNTYSTMASYQGTRQLSGPSTGITPLGSRAPMSIRPRATASGSPMPFARRKVKASPTLLEREMSRANSASPNVLQHWEGKSGRAPAASPVSTASEHFQPGWYYARHPIQASNKATDTLYSFSTAAAKLTGESAAPDARIRDSYRTDTLTPLAKPVNRFRRNGVGADLGGQVTDGNNRLAPQLKRYSSKARRQGTSHRPEFGGVPFFNSSPPRSVAKYSGQSDPRKRRRDPRALTPDFDVWEDTTVDLNIGQASDLMAIDDDTRAAIRMSILETQTPASLRGERQAIRELSPNVSLWRKGVAGRPYARKKRRPSYWDGDLREIKMSPAGRGGIASSPTVSKRSMIAELEDGHNSSTSIDLDQLEDTGESMT